MTLKLLSLRTRIYLTHSYSLLVTHESLVFFSIEALRSDISSMHESNIVTTVIGSFIDSVDKAKTLINLSFTISVIRIMIAITAYSHIFLRALLALSQP
jgi:hypothetical protein